MGGNILVENSSEGMGSIFHFPVVLQTVPVAVDGPSAEAEEQPINGPLLNILLVEDNPVNQLIATRILEREGHTVALAHNGKEALDVIASEDFHLILMD